MDFLSTRYTINRTSWLLRASMHKLTTLLVGSRRPPRSKTTKRTRRTHTDRLGEQGEMKERRISEELRTTQRKRIQGTCKYFFTSFVVVFFGLAAETRTVYTGQKDHVRK
jgi:hypothetical protein